MDLCRKYKMLSVEKKIVKNLVQFSLNRPLFTQSRSSAESRHVPSSSFHSFVLITYCSSHLQSILRDVSIPVSGGRTSSEAFRNMFTCPFYIWTSSRGSRRTTTSVPFFMYDPFPSRTSLHGSLLFFYFEVEFPHLCLTKTERGNEQNLFSFVQWRREKNVSVYVFLALFLTTHLSLSLQWLDANPSLTFSSFSTSYAPRLWNLSNNKRPMMVRQTDDSTTATTARAVVRL